ncbi:predicted protein [Naegleria gruberi]|uniref:Predicted protein n=1 Tax=Naegleria gruberi TaxID=5762 RepID=D2VXF2_NAEGR|nr:uncharacterized protein NAEGRDRAFT_73726 [Naegleria gruberi]EFC38427.1 predicted protein [Naegleria gruberi]|eukprot:XP_002671171.1 predicted protein [Naegleria gruberi strain NEG-M]
MPKSAEQQIEEQSQIQEIIQNILIDQEQINQLRTKQKQATLAESSIDKLKDDEKVWSCGIGGFFIQVDAKEMREMIREEKKVCKSEQSQISNQIEESQKLLTSIDPTDVYKLQQLYLK